MSIAGLGTYSSSSFYQASVTKSRIKELPTGTELFGKVESQNTEKQCGRTETANQAVFTPPYYGCKTVDIKTKEEQVTPLGIGFANAGSMGYGLYASLVTKPGCDDTIIRVKIATGSDSEFIDVNLSNFDPKKATAVEMFAYCQYLDATGEGVNSKWGSWNVIKTVISPSDGMDFGSLDNIMNQRMNWIKALAESQTVLENETTGVSISASDLLKLFEEKHKITAEDLKEDKDWREMSADEWDKMLEGIDKYIEAYKERLKQMKEKQDEAAKKAAREAAPEMRTIAASSAALKVASNGFAGGTPSEDETVGGTADEKNWTKNLKTDDQTILCTAKAAQDRESMAMSKYQEVMLVDDTTVGVGKTEGATECATVAEDEKNEKVWTITAFTEQGIESKKIQDGKVISQWKLNYKNPEDAEKVWDFLEHFDKDADLKFSGSQEFWEEFLTENVDGNTRAMSLS